jgi:hypothetical protein
MPGSNTDSTAASTGESHACLTGGAGVECFPELSAVLLPRAHEARSDDRTRDEAPPIHGAQAM